MASVRSVLIEDRINTPTLVPFIWTRLWQLLLLFWMCSTIVDCVDGLDAVADAVADAMTGDHSYQNNTHNNFDMLDNYDNYNQLTANNNNETRVLRRGKRYLEFTKGSRMSVGFLTTSERMWLLMSYFHIHVLSHSHSRSLSPSYLLCSGVRMAKTISSKSTHCSPMVMVFEPIIQFPTPRNSARKTAFSLSGIYFPNWKPP